MDAYEPLVYEAPQLNENPEAASSNMYAAIADTDEDPAAVDDAGDPSSSPNGGDDLYAPLVGGEEVSAAADRDPSDPGADQDLYAPLSDKVGILELSQDAPAQGSAPAVAAGASPAPSAPPAPAVQRTPSGEPDEGMGFNERFQKLLEQPASSAAKVRKRQREINTLAEEFRQMAIPIARRIVLERGGTNPTHQPIDAGGVAGGLKYLVDGLFFKYAVDENNLYGSDRFAGKAAKHELHALNNIVDAGVSNLHVPLYAVLDFLGQRLSVACLLPLDKHSLKYGSADGGKTVFGPQDLPTDAQRVAMEDLGIALNLKPHVVNGKTLRLAGDVEGHIGTEDGRLYIIDTARCMPPTTPSLHQSATLLPVAPPADPTRGGDGAAVADEVTDQVWSFAAVEQQAKKDRRQLPPPALLAYLADKAGLAPGEVTLRRAVIVPVRAAVWWVQPKAGQPAGPVNATASHLANRTVRGPALLLRSFGKGREFLYQLMRPEAVASNPNPLSSDAFSRWGMHDAKEHNAQVRTAYSAVIAEGVPRAAAAIDAALASTLSEASEEWRGVDGAREREDLKSWREIGASPSRGGASASGAPIQLKSKKPLGSMTPEERTEFQWLCSVAAEVQDPDSPMPADRRRELLRLLSGRGFVVRDVTAEAMRRRERDRQALQGLGTSAFAASAAGASPAAAAAAAAAAEPTASSLSAAVLQLKSMLHSAGVNTRLLGLVRQRLASPASSSLALAEAVSRVLRRSVESLFRRMAPPGVEPAPGTKVVQASEASATALASAFLGIVLGGTVAECTEDDVADGLAGLGSKVPPHVTAESVAFAAVADGKTVDQLPADLVRAVRLGFWRCRAKPELRSTFPGVLSPAESQLGANGPESGVDLRLSLCAGQDPTSRAGGVVLARVLAVVLWRVTSLVGLVPATERAVAPGFPDPVERRLAAIDTLIDRDWAAGGLFNLREGDFSGVEVVAHTIRLATPRLANAADNPKAAAGVATALEQQLAVKERILGADHPAVAAKLLELAELYELRGDTRPRALPAVQRALGIYEKAYGRNSLQAAHACTQAVVLLKQPSEAQADSMIGYAKRAFEIRKAVLGHLHTQTCKSRSNLAGAHLSSGRLEEGERLLGAARRAACIAAVMVSRRLPRPAPGESMVAEAAEVSGMTDEQLGAEADEAILNGRVDSELALIVVGSTANLAQLLRMRGDVPGSLALARRAVHVASNATVLADEAKVGDILFNYASTLGRTGQDTEEATQALRNALAFMKRNMAGQSLGQCQLAIEAAAQLARTGGGEEGRELMKETMATLADIEGEDSQHYGTACIKYSQLLVQTQGEQGMEPALRWALQGQSLRLKAASAAGQLHRKHPDGSPVLPTGELAGELWIASLKQRLGAKNNDARLLCQGLSHARRVLGNVHVELEARHRRAREAGRAPGSDPEFEQMADEGQRCVAETAAALVRMHYNRVMQGRIHAGMVPNTDGRMIRPCDEERLQSLKFYTEAVEIGGKLSGRGDGDAAYNVACLHAQLGNAEHALGWLEASVRYGFTAPTHLAADPDFEPYRQHPRFQAVVQQMQASEQRGAGRPKQGDLVTGVSLAVPRQLVEAVGKYAGLVQQAVMETVQMARLSAGNGGGMPGQTPAGQDVLGFAAQMQSAAQSGSLADKMRVVRHLATMGPAMQRMAMSGMTGATPGAGGVPSQAGAHQMMAGPQSASQSDSAARAMQLGAALGMQSQMAEALRKQGHNV